MTPKAQQVRLLEFLNDALERDPAAISALFTNRVPCRETLEGTCQVWQSGNQQTVGPLGVINGMLVAMGLDMVTVEIDKQDHNRVTNFSMLSSHSHLVKPANGNIYRGTTKKDG